MVEISSDNTVAALTLIYAKASTFPCKVRTQDGGEWVMKFKGAGPGPVGLLTEFVALRAAKAMQLKVPSACPLYLSPGFPWTLGTDEFDGIVQRSFGWNLGVAFISDAEPASLQQVQSADRQFLDRLVQVDRVLVNTDRSARNTNMLCSAGGLVAIDFDACLFLRRAARGIAPDVFPLWPDHLLQDREPILPMQALPGEVLTQAVDEAPSEWLQAAGIERESLKRGLAQYSAAWNALTMPRMRKS